MDMFYNKTEASEQTSSHIHYLKANHPSVRYLEDIFEEHNSNSNSLQMYGMTPEAVDRFKLSIAKEDLDTASKLVKQDEETQELEEATVAVQGILCKAMLLPFDLKIRYMPKARLIPMPEFIRSIKVTNDSRSSIVHPSIVASNRLFTPAKQASGLDPIEISSEMDPCSILAKVDQSRWIHTEDNEVVYYILAEDGSVPDWEHSRSPSLNALCAAQGQLHCQVNTEEPPPPKWAFTTKATTARTLLVAAATSKPPPCRLKWRNVYTTDLHSRKTTSASKGCIDAEKDYSELLEPAGEQVHNDFEDGRFDELAEPVTDNVCEAGAYGMLMDA
ncbi:hypothetical protein BDN71DRAFT_1431419 [Pleurotus eryngii]|uniref:Uncharacterized protein n=1 Tax=Pleurotus eryngii TaxID=5323 RepID=A0A9P5ZZ55_PLEER|nr:hypothetical protein BDN71DRAFT_1431419 [Pleurotus eryngii]